MQSGIMHLHPAELPAKACCWATSVLEQGSEAGGVVQGAGGQGTGSS